MAALTVLPEEDALPGAEAEATVIEGDDFSRAGERHLDVAGHVVGTLVGVGEVGVVLRHEAVDEAFKVAAGGGVGVFHDNQAAAGMAAEDRDRTFVEARLKERLLNHVGELGRCFAGCGHLDTFGKDGHVGYKTKKEEKWEV